jgi:hypothetical protein
MCTYFIAWSQPYLAQNLSGEELVLPAVAGLFHGRISRLVLQWSLVLNCVELNYVDGIFAFCEL